MRTALLLLVPLAIAGCATLSLKEATGPDGGKIFEAICRGGDYTFADCLNLAAQQCKGGYEILERDAGGKKTQKKSKDETITETSSAPDMKAKGMTFRCKKLDTAVVP